MQDPSNTPCVVLLTADLMLTSRVQNAARGVAVRPAGSLDAAAAAAAEGPAVAVVVDLLLPGIDPHAVRQALASVVPEARTIAVAPHVHAQRLATAREAGFSEVMSRGQFDREVENVLAEAAD
ncbi:MAG: hypothetical protein AAGA92_13125 [Planctomycetota bacterium]